jgi:glycosyltransferase involved in cell wall biosynthesis
LAPTIAFLLKGYPRLSETFIAQEIRALEERGLDIRIVSLRRPTDRARHPVHREIEAPVLYLPEYLHEEPLRVLAAWRRMRRLPGYARAFAAFRADLVRDPTRNRLRRFGQALVLAAELPAGVQRLHAHFLHTPASVARYASLLLSLPWSASAHAKDIWTTPDWEKREKLRSLDWLVTCTAQGRDHLAALAPDPAKVELVYHGLDFARFPQPPHGEGEARARSPRDGSDAQAPVRLLSVGRAVAKKGYEVLLAALAKLPQNLHWCLVHIGGGPLGQALEAQARHLGIADRIEWRGAQPQEHVLSAYRAADLFVLASLVAADGDRDGLPNVLMEAQSQRTAVISSALPGIAELIEHGRTGLLVPPADAPALAAALERLIREPALREALAEAGLARLRRDFDMTFGIARLAQRFGLPAQAGREIDPAQAGRETDPAQAGRETDPAQAGRDGEPVEAGREALPAAADRKAAALALGAAGGAP